MRNGKIDGQFAPRLIEMLRSPAFRALSLSGHRILTRIEIELASHGGKDNGKLPVTYANLKAFGICNRDDIARGIRLICALGFVENTRRGRGGNREFHAPNLFRLTYLPAHGKPPTHEWRRIKTIEEAEKIASEARRPVKNRRRKKQKPGHEKQDCTVTKNGTVTGHEKQDYHPKTPVTENGMPIYTSSHLVAVGQGRRS